MWTQRKKQEPTVTQLTSDRRLPLVETLEIRRLLSAGQLDASFGNGGVVVTDGGLSAPTSVVVQSDGKILVTASRDGGGGATRARYNPDGSLDSTFGNNGIADGSIIN